MKYVLFILVLVSCNSKVSHKKSSSGHISKQVKREFYDNRNLKKECMVVDGKEEGLCKEWYEDGTLSLEGYYKGGKANGLMKWYSEKGHLAAVGNMIDDKRNGEWTICDWQDANFCSTGMFKDEVMYGSWKSFYENGQLGRENIWEDQQLLKSTCWDDRGNEIDCD